MGTADKWKMRVFILCCAVALLAAAQGSALESDIVVPEQFVEQSTKQFGSTIAEDAEEGVVDPEIVGSSFGSAGLDAEALGSSAAIGVADGGEDLLVSGSGAALKH